MTAQHFRGRPVRMTRDGRYVLAHPLREIAPDLWPRGAHTERTALDAYHARIATYLADVGQAREDWHYWRDVAAGFLPAVGCDDVTLHTAARFLRRAADHVTSEVVSETLDAFAALGWSVPRADEVTTILTPADDDGPADVRHRETDDAPIADSRTPERLTLTTGSWESEHRAEDHARDADYLRVMADRLITQADGALGEHALLGSRWRAFEDVRNVGIGHAVKLRRRMGASIVGETAPDAKRSPWRASVAHTSGKVLRKRNRAENVETIYAPSSVRYVPRPEGWPITDMAMLRGGVVMVPTYRYATTYRYGARGDSEQTDRGALVAPPASMTYRPGRGWSVAARRQPKHKRITVEGTALAPITVERVERLAASLAAGQRLTFEHNGWKVTIARTAKAETGYNVTATPADGGKARRSRASTAAAAAKRAVR